MKYTVFSETAKKTEHAEEKKKVFTGKKRRLSAADGFNKIDKALEAFMNYQQEADRRFWEAEEERERREEERDEKRRKEDQEFFLKLMQALNKWNRYFHTGLRLLSKLQSYFVTELKTESNRKLSLFNFQWTKILYQNNIGFFFYIFQGLKMESVKWMWNFTRIVKTQVKFWKFHVYDII